jgi:hypothetical protein
MILSWRQERRAARMIGSPCEPSLRELDELVVSDDAPDEAAELAVDVLDPGQAGGVEVLQRDHPGLHRQDDLLEVVAVHGERAQQAEDLVLQPDAVQHPGQDLLDLLVVGLDPHRAIGLGIGLGGILGVGVQRTGYEAVGVHLLDDAVHGLAVALEGELRLVPGKISALLGLVDEVRLLDVPVLVEVEDVAQHAALREVVAVLDEACQPAMLVRPDPHHRPLRRCERSELLVRQGLQDRLGGLCVHQEITPTMRRPLPWSPMTHEWSVGSTTGVAGMGFAVIGSRL